MMNKIEISVLFFLLCFFFIQCVGTNINNSITYDEPTHILSGINYFNEKIPFNLEHPPIAKLWAGLPSLFIYSENNEMQIQKMLFYSRLQITFIALLLGVFVFLFSKKLFGTKKALISLFLFSFSPNIIAHSTLVTNDLMCIAFGFISIYFLYLAINEKKIFYVFSIFFLALSVNARFSGFLYLLLVLILLNLNKEKIKKQKINSIKLNWIKVFFIYVIFIILITNVIYFFALNDFSSNFVPETLIKGLNEGFHHLERGHSSFFLGEFNREANPLFFLISFLIKTPITTIILFLLSIKIFFEKKKNSKNYFLLIPILLIFLILSFGSTINIGLRHILGIYPFLFVFIGNSIEFFEKNTFKKIIFGILCLWYFLTAMFIFPHYLGYFNEFIGGPNNGYKYLIDSNLDWGQNQKYLENYLKENPEAIFNPGCEKTKGKIVLNANEFHGLRQTEDFIKCELNKDIAMEFCGKIIGLNPNCYSWIDSNPVEFITPSLLVFEVT